MVTLFRFLKYQQAANRSTHKLTHHVQQRIVKIPWNVLFRFIRPSFNNDSRVESIIVVVGDKGERKKKLMEKKRKN